MSTNRSDRSHLRLEVSPGSVLLVLVAIAAAFLAATVLVEARRIVSWVVACAVAAALIELIVEWLDRWVNRVVAVVVVLLGIAAVSGVMIFGVFHDLDIEVRRFQIVAPIAAESIEQNTQFGKLATELDLDQRVTEAVRQLNTPSSGLAGDAVSSVSAYIVCAVLTILFLSWGPRLARGALKQVSNESAERFRVVAHLAFTHSRRYVVLSMAQAFTVGLIGWGLCKWLDTPAPAPLALALAALSLVPTVGIAVGALPILLLAAGLEPMRDVGVAALAFLLMGLVSTFIVQPRIVKLSNLYVGPAIITIGALAGFELYGIGGAMYAAAISVLVAAIIDASAEIPAPAVATDLPGAHVQEGESDVSRQE